MSPSSEDESPAETQTTLNVAPPPSPLLPPSYSLALGLDLHGGQLEPGFRKRPSEEPSGESGHVLADPASAFCPLTSHIQALTASELLKNR